MSDLTHVDLFSGPGGFSAGRGAVPGRASAGLVTAVGRWAGEALDCGVRSGGPLPPDLSLSCDFDLSGAFGCAASNC